jgi:hypothetical protein
LIMNYSVDMMKRAAFHDELVNLINTMPVENVDEDIVAVKEYLTRRLKEFDRKYK